MNSRHEDMAAAVMPDSTQPNYTLKILFGPLFGCQLHLPADDYFLIINPALTPQGRTDSPESHRKHAAHYAQNTLYIPSDLPSPNITLILSEALDNDGARGFRTAIDGVEGSYDSTVHLNQVFILGPVRFALKLSEDDWSDEVRHINRPADPILQYSDTQSVMSLRKKKMRAILLGTPLLILLLVLASLVWFKKVDSEQHVLTLSEILVGAPSPLDIVKARDNNNIYVLAHNLQEMEWAKEALFKLRENTNVIPVWLKEQQLTVVTRLQRSGYPVMQIDYAQPQHPLLSVYRQLTAVEAANVKASALQHIPFALDVGLRVRTKNQLLQEARQGLDRMHITYRQIDTSTGYGLIVRDALSDNALSSLRYFINEFNQQWGNSTINFSINLDENWLQNKSYVDSSDGYLFMSPRHWYFPIQQGYF